MLFAKRERLQNSTVSKHAVHHGDHEEDSCMRIAPGTDYRLRVQGVRHDGKPTNYILQNN